MHSDNIRAALLLTGALTMSGCGLVEKNVHIPVQHLTIWNTMSLVY